MHCPTLRAPAELRQPGARARLLASSEALLANSGPGQVRSGCALRRSAGCGAASFRALASGGRLRVRLPELACRAAGTVSPQAPQGTWRAERQADGQE